MEDYRMAKYHALYYHEKNAWKKHMKKQWKSFLDAAGKSSRKMMASFAFLHL